MWEHITEIPSFYKGFYKISQVVATATLTTIFYKEMVKNNEEKNLCWFINGFWITKTVEMCIQQPVIRIHMNLAWQLPLWKWILTDWICYETSSFYPETVIRNREMDASAIAWKIFINSCCWMLQNWNIFEKPIPAVEKEKHFIRFNIFITNVGSGTELTLSKYGYDIELGGIVKHPDKRASLQRDFSKAEGKADRTIMKFSNDRCQCCNWARATAHK